MRILTLFAKHGSQKYAEAKATADALFARCLPQAQREVVVIDSALPASFQEQTDLGGWRIGSDNTSWEFSSWDSGLAFVGERLHDFDFVHLATSAFDTLYTGYLDRLDARTLSLAAGRAMAVGHVDCYPTPVSLFGRRSQGWLRTSWLFLPPLELALLGSLVSVRDEGLFFGDDPATPFRPDAPLCPGYRTYILDWLTGPGTGQNVEWHSRFALDGETWSYFKAKARAILNEHMLSIRLAAQGCAMVDAIWLSTRGGVLPQGQGLGALPNWRQQLSARDTCPQSPFAEGWVAKAPAALGEKSEG